MYLLSNALKFTENGEVVLSVNVRSRTDAGALLEFEVRDTGIGIEADKLELLFESFRQADVSTTRRYGGTGLGLSITKQLTELMGGRVEVHSVFGEGSSFRAVIPFAECTPPDEALRDDGTVLNGLRALIVDDNATNRDILQRELERWDMVVTAAPSADAALETAREARQGGVAFDVVISDLHRPVKDGLDLHAELDADPWLRGLPFIILSSLGTRPVLEQARSQGVAGYLTKPVRRRRLLETLRDVVTTGRSEFGQPAEERSEPGEELRLTTATQAGEPPGPGRPRPREDAPLVLLVEDNLVNQKLARLLLEAFGYRVMLACNGREAVEAFETETFAAILMDCQMPILDGYGATLEIRRREARGRRTPILAMTAHAMEGDRQRVLDAGMDDYVSKPVNADVLRDTLLRWIPVSSST